MTEKYDHQTIDQMVRDYISRRGIFLEFRCSRCVRSVRLNLGGIDGGQRLSMKVNYIGPAQDRPDSLHTEQDPWCYRWLGSPFPEKPDTCVTYGYHRDTSKALWAEYYNSVCLKDPGIYDNGIRIEVEVPDIVACKEPRWQVFCNGEEVLNETISAAGIMTRTISVRGVSRQLAAYMTDVRRQQKAVMSEFTQICSKYRLKWYLICGGLIGLVRDGSLIPWDDDLDIAMPLTDYKRFLIAARREWQDGRIEPVLPNQYGSVVFHDQMTRLVYKAETIDGDPFERLGARARGDLHHHLTVDLYILQDAYDNRLKHRLQTRTLQLLYGLALGHRENLDLSFERPDSRARLIAARILSRMGKIIPIAVIQRWYDRVMHRSKGKGESCYFLANGYHACIPMRFKKTWFGQGRNKEICDMVFRIPEKADLFLETMYGDYQKFPHFFDRYPGHYERAEKRHYYG